MSDYLNSLEEISNAAYTENGALSYATTLSDCLDLFATIGALRNASDEEIIERFDKAWAENPDLAVKTLFFARDVRGGLGERRVFRTIFRHMADDMPGAVRANVENVPEYGRFDDLLVMLESPLADIVLEYITETFRKDMESLECGEPITLLAKWMPSINASNAETRRAAKIVVRAIGMSYADYRKALSRMRSRISIIENNLRERDYTFDYERQPSKALFKYRRAFNRNDEARYRSFLESVSSGKANLKTGSLYPYDIVRPFFDHSVCKEDRLSLDVTWNAQEDFTNGENAIVVVDGSGSMYGGGNPLPISVALSLGIYFAERNNGVFARRFITFSENPRLVEIKGCDIFEKVKYCASFNEVANTNIQGVFELLLNAAIKNDAPQGDLPSTVYIISDMEFDSCARDADERNFERARKAFEDAGYKLPRIVFWNVQSRNLQQPVTMNENGVVLVSGASPRVFGMIRSGNLSPMAFMLEILGGERYAKIQAA
jgi:hypothetical protein